MDVIKKIVETAICVTNMGPGAGQPGDIVVAREPLMYVGTAELSLFLWLWVETGLVGEVMLTEPGAQEKRRYRVSLSTLAKMRPDLDMRRVTDPYMRYQPFMELDRLGYRKGVMEALPAADLIIDKMTGRLMRG